jgi:fatty-acyl-CoA synthase
MGLIACAIMPAVLGVPVTALSPFHWITRPALLLRVIHEDRCTLTWLPNFAYEFLATRVRASEVSGLRLDSMRGWINCSEPTIAETHRRFLERFQPIGVRPETLWTCYAAAETTFAVSQSSVAVAPRVEQVARERFLKHGEALPVPDSSAAALELMSAGRLLGGTHVRITDERGEDLPERRVGEIAIRSDSLFSGYFKDPESTAAALRNGWYYSGDLGYLAEGHLFITGRKKDLIIIAGTNYYPQDIERIVSDVPGVHPGRVVAFGVDDASVGTQRLVVMAEIDDPTQIDSPDLTAAVRTAISERLDCVIHDLRLVPHMWLLKTSSGKIARGPNLRRYLAELAGKAREATGSSAL